MKSSDKDVARRAQPRRKRILLVEDHPLTREGMAQWINRQRDMEVCSEVGSVPEAHTAIEKLSPELVLLDVSLSGGDGLELIKDIRAHHPTLPVLVFSMHEESLYGPRAMRVCQQTGGGRPSDPGYP
jgi:DNA-binding NarL/FixJ family response regulator